MEVKTTTSKTTVSTDPRAPLREARAARLKVIAGDRPPTVKVFAANETMRRVLRHSNGARFRTQLDQGIEWPNDNFTARRIADGSVRLEAASSTDEQPVDPSLNSREQAAAQKPQEPSEPKASPPPQPPKSRAREPERAEASTT